MFRIAFMTFIVSAALLISACGKDEEKAAAAPTPPQQPTSQPADPSAPQPAQPGQPGQPQGGDINNLQPGQCACDKWGCIYMEKSGCYYWEIASCDLVPRIQECETRCR